MIEELKKDVDPQIESFTFMLEVVKHGNDQKYLSVRVPARDGSARIVCFGFLKEFNQFIESL